MFSFRLWSHDWAQITCLNETKNKFSPPHFDLNSLRCAHTPICQHTRAFHLASIASSIAHRVFYCLEFNIFAFVTVQLKAGNTHFLPGATADLFAKVCTGMFLRVGAVSSECRGHPGGSEFTCYVSAIEEVLCYMLKGDWNSVFRGRSGWPRQELFSNRKMIKILMTWEDNMQSVLIFCPHEFICIHVVMAACASVSRYMKECMCCVTCVSVSLGS